MKEQLAKIEREALEAITGAENPAALEELRVRYLGKKGELTAVLKQMGKLSAQDRPAMGALANEVRSVLEETIELTSQKLAAAALDLKMKAEALDVTIPGQEAALGHKHPMYIALDEIKDIFVGMGFTVLDGPEVELASYNFDKLNAEEDERAAKRDAERKLRMEEAKKRAAEQREQDAKRPKKQPQKSGDKKPPTTEAGRVGERPYARGRSYRADRYDEKE